MPTRTQRPKVFLSYARPDRPAVLRLAGELRRHGVEPFVDVGGIEVSENFVLAVNQALAGSDHYVLLWSKHCVDRPWVEEEWSAAYAREVRDARRKVGDYAEEVHKRRSFLFVVRLDETPLPPLLATRRYLDGVHAWPTVARDLAAAWRGDLAVGTPVLPPPEPGPVTATPAVAIRVRNKALGVTHVVVVPSESTGDDLLPVARKALALPDSQSQFNGAVEVRFTYRLLHDGDAVLDAPLIAQDITERTVLDLEVQVEARGPDGPFGARVFRHATGTTPEVPPEIIRSLVRTAFSHLLP